MITYQYGEYNPEEEPSFTPEKLMQILSDLIMKYEVSMEEALRMIIEKGLPVNLFLKEGGMGDLIQNFKEDIQKQIQDILQKYNLNPVQEKMEKNQSQDAESILKRSQKLKNLQAELKQAFHERNTDQIRRIKWNHPKMGDLSFSLDKWLLQEEEKAKFSQIIQKYNFQGKEIPTIPEAKQIALRLEQLQALAQALQDAIDSGDLYNLDLEKIAQFLGAESYQEFLERRESIFEKLSQLLKDRGEIVQSEDGELKLSPASIRKIGMTALSEIFSNMKSDGTGSHNTKDFGDSENLTSRTRAFQFGDNVSQIDFPTSILNSLHRGNSTRPGLMDLEVHEARGSAKSATVILLDMSGSMSRSMRFFNAKKMTLAMNALIQKDYKDDKLIVIGFGTLAKLIPIPSLPTLQPYPVTIFNPYIKLRFDLSKMSSEQIDSRVPLYFTNLQRGLNLARQVLGSKQFTNKDIFLITDGAPTSHFKGSVLHVNYPPTPADFEEALNEVKLCKEDGITLNTFLLTTEWDFNYFGEKSFIQQFAKISQGRIFYPHPNELNKMVLYDFLNNKKKKFSF